MRFVYKRPILKQVNKVVESLWNTCNRKMIRTKEKRSQREQFMWSRAIRNFLAPIPRKRDTMMIIFGSYILSWGRQEGKAYGDSNSPAGCGIRLWWWGISHGLGFERYIVFMCWFWFFYFVVYFYKKEELTLSHKGGNQEMRFLPNEITLVNGNG